MVKSLTKNRKSNEEIINMIQKGLGNVHVIEIEELTEGFFNVAYLIKLGNDINVILKIAPPADALVMIHEKNIMNSEVTSMKMVEELTNCPVAKIIYYDNSHTLCDSDYFIMENLEGKSFASIMDILRKQDKDKINYEIGAYNKQLNSICGKKFGYFGQDTKQGEVWSEVFKTMVQDVICDAKRLCIDLKISGGYILELLDRDKRYFKDVNIPRFVHWDLWAGNVFVLNGKITGIIDFERCLWADELMEVGFRTYNDNKYFLEGYGIGTLDDEQKIRAKWYDVYLFLISCLEYKYRNYETMDLYNWGTGMLKKWIDEFEKRME